MVLKKFQPKPERLTLVVVVLAVAAIGAIVLAVSHASTPYASTDADTGTLTGAATSQTCNGADDGNCVVFGGTAASFTYSPTTPAVGDAVQYTSTSTCDAAPCTYSYGNQQSDGTYTQFATTANASFTYANVGTKVVQLTVTDAQGHTDTSTQSIVVADAGTGGGTGTGGPLPWAPPGYPDYSGYTTKTITTADESSLPYTLNLTPTTGNFIVKLPSTNYMGAIRITGGNNVVIIGGQITVPNSANVNDNDSDSSDEGLLMEHQTGTVFLEGLLLGCQASPATMCDGFNFEDQAANIVMENNRAVGLYGTNGADGNPNNEPNEHADVIETWGGANSLDIYNLTGSGDYQGLTIGPVYSNSAPVASGGCGGECTVKSYDLRNVNLINLPVPSSLQSVWHGGGKLMLVTSYDKNCTTTGPMWLTNIYIEDQNSQVGTDDQTWPSATDGGNCPGVISGSTQTWPALTNIKGAGGSGVGHVTLSAPPGGDFVPAGVAGTSYVSPGY
jgi:hypothetical protein